MFFGCMFVTTFASGKKRCYQPMVALANIVVTKQTDIVATPQKSSNEANETAKIIKKI